MSYQPLNPYYGDHPQAIYLYTTPLKYQRDYFKLKQPIDIFAHWAVCIQGRCYEVTRNRDPNKKKKDPKHIMNFTDEQAWLYQKNQVEGRECKKEPNPVGYTVRLFSNEEIQRVALRVWEKSLKSKYVYDENNCQVFIRLLVELIGDPATKATFPESFDKWVKIAGRSRDGSVMIFVAGASVVAATASLAATPVDPTGTAAAGFAASSMLAFRSSMALMTDRYDKEKFIENSQKEIREQLRLEGILV